MQYTLLNLTGRILMPAVAFRAAGAPETMVIFAVCASLVICGAVTALHARPLGRVGAGYILTVGPPSVAIAVTVDALNAGGTILLAMLTITAAAMQIAFALRLSLLRGLLTPSVSGTVLMLVSVAILPMMFGMLDDVPAGTDAAAAPLCAGVVLATVAGIAFKGPARLRAWGPALGILAGSVVAAFYGLYDFDQVADARWIGTPAEWPTHFGAGLAGIDFAAYATLLPAFVFLFLVFNIRSMSVSLAVQAVSWRQRRAMDFRAVQRTIAADAFSNLAAGLVGTMPHSTGSGAASRVEITGVAARPVGLVVGAILVLVAFCPKAVAVVLAIPAPVFAGYVIVAVASTFTIGLKMAVAEGADQRQRLIVGLSFWLGAGCQYGFVFPDFVATFAAGMFKSALTAGGLVAIALTAMLVLTAPRRRRMQTRLDVSALPELQDFVRELVARHRWRPALAARLEAVAEEALLTLVRDGQESTEGRRLLVAASREGRGAMLEFVAAGVAENIEDRLAVLGETATEETIERDVSLRLLRHLATEVRHRQYHDVDILTLRVETPTV